MMKTYQASCPEDWPAWIELSSSSSSSVRVLKVCRLLHAVLELLQVLGDGLHVFDSRLSRRNGRWVRNLWSGGEGRHLLGFAD